MAASIGGMIGTWSPGGASTQTNATPRSVNHPSVASMRSLDTQARWRSSIATGRERSSETRLSSSSSSYLPGLKAGVICTRNAPSLPASASGVVSSTSRRRQRLLELLGEDHAAALVRPDVVAEVGRQRVDRRGVPRQRAVGLDVEDEVIGRGPHPAVDHVAVGDRVEARVELHGLEALGVVRQPVACAGILGGYHSLTKPGSAQLEVPTRMRPMTDEFAPRPRSKGP